MAMDIVMKFKLELKNNKNFKMRKQKNNNLNLSRRIKKMNNMLLIAILKIIFN